MKQDHLSPFPAPNRTLTAVGSGREITFDTIGLPAVVTFCVPGSQQLVDDVVRAVRRSSPLPSELCNANVVDLSSVPRVLRKAAELVMELRYRDACKNVSAGRDPADYIVMLPDWEGDVSRAFGFAELDGQLGIALIDAAGIVLERCLEAN